MIPRCTGAVLARAYPQSGEGQGRQGEGQGLDDQRKRRAAAGISLVSRAYKVDTDEYHTKEMFDIAYANLELCNQIIFDMKS